MQRRARYHALSALLVSLMLLTAAAPASAAPCQNSDLIPSASNLSKIRSAVRCLINQERTSRGIAALKTSGALTNAARRHSNAMVRDGFFDHRSPTNESTPKSRITAAGYRGSCIGENIAWGSGSFSTPRQIVSNWMTSAGHRRSILDRDFRDWGIGVVNGGPGDDSGATYTTTFGAKY